MPGLVWMIVAGLAASSGAWTDAAAAHFNRGLAHLASNRFEEAAQAFGEAARAAPPGSPEPVYNLALTDYRARRFEEALAVLDRVPDLPAGRVLRARALRAMGRREEALAVWQEAWEAGILGDAGLWHLARLLDLYELPEKRLAVLESLARRSGEAAAAVEQADVLVSLGRLDEARRALRGAAARLAPERDDDPREAAAIVRAVHLLRSLEGYGESVHRLERGHGPGVGDDPLPLAVAPPPGPSPFPIVSAALDAELAGGAAGICTDGSALWVVGGAGARRFVREAGGFRSEGDGVARAAHDCLAADLDRDRRRDLVLLTGAGPHVAWGDGTALDLPGPATAAAAVDHDLDGDADLVAAGAEGPRLWRNNRDRTFTDVTGASGLAAAAPGAALGVLAADFDGDGAAELYVTRAGRPNVLVAGLARDRARVVWESDGAAGPATAADLDGDGDLDLIAGGRPFLNDGRGRFTAAPPLAGVATTRRLGTADLDLDGWTDLLVETPGGALRIFRNEGDGRFAAWTAGLGGGVADAAAGDFDGDGVIELVLLAGGGLHLASVPAPGRGLALETGAEKDNPDALGSRVDLFSGRRRLHRQVRLGTHEIGEQGPRLVLGTGERRGGEWLRITWPNGTWSEAEEAALRDAAGAGETVRLVQPATLSGSCPFLYVRDGEGFRFVTDVLGGSPLGLPLGGGRAMPVDPDEYVLIDGTAAAARGGFYELRITEELREVLYLDHVELLVVDRPAGVVVATDDGLRSPPFPAFRLYAADDARPPRAAVDHRGRDVRDRLLAVDGRYPDGFAWIDFQGYAEPHSLTLDFPPIADRGRALLVVTGGYYWSEAEHVALAQTRAVAPELPRLEVWRDRGWHTVLEAMPFPGGRVKTVAVDLGGRLPPGRGPVRLRISSNLRLYFDRLLLGTDRAAELGLRTAALRPATAELAARGYSRAGPFDGRVPPPFDYQRTVPGRPYPRFPGLYTRFGDVGELVRVADDAMVVMHHGEEVRLTFAAPAAPPAGWRRDLVVHLVGWDKDGDPKTAASTTVEPLPFRGMSRYPYVYPERFPWTPELRELDRRLRTRWIGGGVLEREN